MGTCHNCGKDKSNSNLFSFVNELMIYEDYCLQCAREKLSAAKLPQGGNVKEMRESAYKYNIQKQNEVMADPEKLKKVMETSPMRELYKKLGREK